MSRKSREEATTTMHTGYTGEAVKKGPVLVVRFKDGSLMQFPMGCTYHFRTVNAHRMCVIQDGGSVIAHIAHGEIRSVSCPEYLIRDGDAR